MLNHGPFIVNCSLPFLVEQVVPSARLVLPVCSIGTPLSHLAKLGEWVLPPLYREAMDDVLRAALIGRIRECLPCHIQSPRRQAWRAAVDVVEVTPSLAQPPARMEPAVLAISVDTAVEEHGPHLPLATDRIQSHAVLDRLAAERDDILIAPPADYGQLAWGLGPGMSVDITATLTTAYVTGYVNALIDWARPRAVYVVDVHGSMIHRNAVRQGLEHSRAVCRAFRWLHEPISHLTWGRKDAHAGGAETRLIEAINPEWLDPSWWPGRLEELAAHQMSLDDAVAIGGDVAALIRRAEAGGWNGIVGDIRTYFELDGPAMLNAMTACARADVNELLR